MMDYWEANGPPVHVAVAAYLGLATPDKSVSSRPKDYSNLGELERMFSGTGGSIQ